MTKRERKQMRRIVRAYAGEMLDRAESKSRLARRLVLFGVVLPAAVLGALLVLA